MFPLREKIKWCDHFVLSLSAIDYDDEKFGSQYEVRVEF
jgi:hypothetical protein